MPSALIRWLLPRDDRFFKPFEDHAEVISEAAKIMLDFPSTDGGNIQDVLKRSISLSTAATTWCAWSCWPLDETYVTPIDREDIPRWRPALDNVLDYMYSAAQLSFEVRELTQAMRDGCFLPRGPRPARYGAGHPPQPTRQSWRASRMQIVAMEKRGDAISPDRDGGPVQKSGGGRQRSCYGRPYSTRWRRL